MAMEVAAALETDAPEVAAIDTETSGVSYFDEPFCATIAWRNPQGELRSGYFEIAQDDVKSTFREAVAYIPTWVFHNAKFDIQKLLLVDAIDMGVVYGFAGVEDTHALAHLLNEQWPGKLKDLAVELLGRDDTIEVPLKTDPSRTRLVSAEKYHLDQVRTKLKLKVSDGYHVLPREAVIPYALTDAEITLELYEYLKSEMEGQDAALQALYHREMRLSWVLFKMEAAGLGLDLEYIDKTSKRLNGEIAEAERIVLQASGRDKFKQHHQWTKDIMAERGFLIPNSQRETLEKLEDPVAQALVERGRTKKLADYFTQMKNEQRDGILHPSFKQHKPTTGRMSSGEQEVT
jgi:DNA polymerase I-like protein with 3'-5' exonuclease and polymerase domains